MQNKLLDIIKFIAGLFVVAIHQNPFGVNGDTVCWLSICACRWAVPFFFVSSSYLFWRKGKSFVGYAKRLLLLLFVWTIIYSPFIVDRLILQENDIFKFVFSLLFDNDVLMHLWYIVALVEAMGLVWALRNVNNIALLLIGCLLYAISCSYSIYYPAISQYLDMSKLNVLAEYISPTNSFISAFIFIVIGKIVAEKKDMTLSVKRWCLFGLFMSIVMGMVECLLCLDSSRWIQDAMISLPFISYFLMLLVAQYKMKISLSDGFCLFQRNTSIIIYLAHVLFIRLCATFHHSADLKAYGFVIMCSISFSILIQLLAKKCKILKLIY